MATRMQQRRGTAAQWADANPILNVGEIGYETDTNKFKIGDGTNHWNDLVEFFDSQAVNSVINSVLEIEDAPELLNSIRELANALGDDPEFLANYATTSYVDGNIANLASFEYVQTSLTNVASFQYVDDNLINVVYQAGLNEAIANFASIDYVNNNIANLVSYDYLNTELSNVVYQEGLYEAIANLASFDYVDENVANLASFEYVQTSLTNLAPFQYVDDSLTNVVYLGDLAQAIVDFATFDYVDESIANLTSYVDNGLANVVYEDDLYEAIANLASFEYVDGAIAGAAIDISNYAGNGINYNAETDQLDVDASIVQLRVANISDVEIGYLFGVTANIQEQFNNKQDIVEEVSGTEIFYLANVTSDIQEQLDSKAATEDIAELSVDAVANALTSATHTNITVNYNDENGLISLEAAPGYSDENAQDAIGNNIGVGLSYDDSAGSISVDTLVIQARVANVSDTEIGYLDGVTSGIQGQINGKISASSTDTLVNKSINLANNTVSGTLAQFNTAISDADILPTSGGTLTGFLTLHADPTQALHAASKEYVDNISSGIVSKPAVDVATTENITATYDNGTLGVGATLTIAPTATLTIDGKNSWTTGNSVLFKNQTNKAHNGRYVLTTVGDGSNSWVFTRCGLCDEASEIPGAYIFVKGGTANNGTGWVQTVANSSTFTVGTDNIDVYQFSGSGTYTSGTGLTLTGNQFAIDNTVATLTGTQTLTGKTIAGANNTLTVRVANDISGLGTGVATFLATPSSANLASAVTDETGSGALVFGTSPTIVTPRTQLAMNAQTGTTYTLALTDASSRWVTMNNSSASTATVPPDIFDVGDQIAVQQIGTGQVTFAAGSGVTITSAGAITAAPKIRTRYASAVVICTASNVFTIIGDIV
jgi:hypothetical protein